MATSPLTRPRQIPCDCGAPADTPCRKVPADPTEPIAYFTRPHPERLVRFEQIMASNPAATTDPTTWTTILPTGAAS